jgi:hypothetical protein
VIGKLAADLQHARVTEVVRMLRGCRSLDDLADVALWVANHKNEFTAESLAHLRCWYARTRDEITRHHLDELLTRYGPRTAAAAGV